MNKYGIDTIYLSRIGWINKMELRKRGMMSFVWEGHPLDGKKSELFVCLSSAFTYSPIGLAYDSR